MTRSTCPSSLALDLISSIVEPRPVISVLAFPPLSLLPPQPAATAASAPTRNANATQPAVRLCCLFMSLLPLPRVIDELELVFWAPLENHCAALGVERLGR